jgi:hypothetical protein
MPLAEEQAELMGESGAEHEESTGFGCLIGEQDRLWKQPGEDWILVIQGMELLRTSDIQDFSVNRSRI